MKNVVLSSRIKFNPEIQYGGFADVDSTILFYLRVNSLLEPHFVVLDVGCGRGEYQDDSVIFRKQLRNLQGKVKKVIGIDVDPAGADNPFIDVFLRIGGHRWPIEDNSVDLIVCDWVIEHLENPNLFFSEAMRCLQRGGKLCIRTTNVFGYVAFLSALIPREFHKSLLAKVQKQRSPKDIFPTFYRCNSLVRLKRTLTEHGFEGIVYGYESLPAYLEFSSVLYSLGVVWQKFAPNMFKNIIFLFATKQ